MKLCECGSCLNRATSFWKLSNGAFLLKKNKRCSHCSIRIKLNFFILCCILSLAAFNVIFFFMLGHFIFPEQDNIGFYLIIFGVIYIYFYPQVYFGSKYLGLHPFIPIENEKTEAGP